MRVSIAWILTGIIGGLALVIGALNMASFGQLSQAEADIREIYEDPLTMTERLKVVADAYAVSIVDAAHKARNGNTTWEVGSASVRDATTLINENWQAVKAADTSGDEAALIAEVQSLMSAGMAASMELRRILDGRDEAALDSFLRDRLYQSMDPISDAIGGMIAHQIVEAENIVDRALAAFSAMRTVAVVLLCISLVLVIAGIAAVTLLVVRPLKQLTTTIMAIAEGDFEVLVPGTGKQDELGQMARSVDTMRTSLGAASAEKAHALRALADQLENELSHAVEAVARAADEMSGDAQMMAGSADVVSERSTSVTIAAEQTTLNAQAVAAAAEEFAVSTSEIGGQAAEAQKVTNAVARSSREALVTIETLSELADGISNVTALIQGIAEQTNLLALNATIEAARAGEAGRGFAVVAAEVKTLAGQTAKATDDIGKQILAVQAAAGTVVTAMRQIEREIGRTSEVSTAIAAAVEEQVATTKDISRNITQTANAAAEVTSQIGAVSSEADASRQRAATVHRGIGEVAANVAKLRRALVETIRSSSADVDRREAVRVPLQLNCTLSHNGTVIETRTTDVGIGGAAVLSDLRLPIGAMVELRIGGLETTVRASVKSLDEDTIHLAFESGGPSADWISQMTGGSVSRAA